jgi:hypothetical protein
MNLSGSVSQTLRASPPRGKRVGARHALMRACTHAARGSAPADAPLTLLPHTRREADRQNRFADCVNLGKQNTWDALSLGDGLSGAVTARVATEHVSPLGDGRGVMLVQILDLCIRAS